MRRINQGFRGLRLLKTVTDFSPGCVPPQAIQNFKHSCHYPRHPQPSSQALLHTQPTLSTHKTDATEFVKGNPQTDLQLSYIVYERGNDVSPQPPILLHHGLLGRKENLSKTGKLLTHLTKRNIVIPDARNHGNSPSSHEMTHKQMSGDVVRMLGNLEIKETSIFGHGLGGRIGMYTALTRPDLVDKLIVVSASPLNSQPSLDHWEKIRQACYVTQTLAASMNSISKEMLTSMEFKMEADKALKIVLPNPKERALFVSNVGQVNHPAILSNPTLWKFPVMESYCFKKPAMFIRGEYEPVWETDEDIRRIRQIFPNSHFVKIPGAGAYPQLDSHEQLLEATTTFLQTKFN